MALLIVALTGGIATGKSVVVKILKKHGCFIHSADRVAHQLMEPEKPAWKKIVCHFGPQILNADRTIDRSRLGGIVFGNEKERLFLNQVLHPLVLQEKKKIIRSLEKNSHFKIFVSEAALTIESGFAHFFDKIIVVHCQEEIRIKRLMARDKISRKEALQKIRSQMPVQEKLNYADYVIDTSTSLKKTEEQAERVFRCLLLDYKKKNRKEKT